MIITAIKEWLVYCRMKRLASNGAKGLELASANENIAIGTSYSTKQVRHHDYGPPLRNLDKCRCLKNIKWASVKRERAEG